MENRRAVDQRRAAVERFIVGHRENLVCQGAVVATFRSRGDRTLGPYYKLTCRVHGRQHSVYLGNDENLIRDVRERLARMQQPRLERTKLLGVRRTLRLHARDALRQLDAELAKLGLFRKGHEVRGWRSAAARAAKLASLSAIAPTT